MFQIKFLYIKTSVSEMETALDGSYGLLYRKSIVNSCGKYPKWIIKNNFKNEDSLSCLIEVLKEEEK